MAKLQLDNRLLLPAGATSWAALAAGLQARLGPAGPRAAQRTVFVVETMAEACAAVALGVTEGLDFAVIEAGRLTPELAGRFAAAGLHLLVLAGDQGPGAAVAGAEAEAEAADPAGADPGVADPHVPGRITVLSSGTTGLPKLIPHSLDSLNTFARVQQMPAQSWFLPYQIGSYAWYQMVALSLFVPGQDLVPGDFTDLAGSFEAALRAGLVTAISSTPTFWRHALMAVDTDLLAAAPIGNLSMGGEIVDQAILDRLAGLYPEARIRHIYASSEAGAAIVVSDGLAGFDAALLGRGTGPVALRIEDGRLFIRSRYGNAAEAGGWIDSGDLVEIREGRVQFLGRAGNTMINVGGQKAFPPDIEAHLLRHPEVVWARVTARRAPMVGHLPVASVVLRRPMAAEAAEALLIAHCSGALADYAIPRLWDFPDQIPLRASLKS